MKLRFYTLFLLIILLMSNIFCASEIQVRTAPDENFKPVNNRSIVAEAMSCNYTAEDLVNELLGSGVTASNVQYIGSDESAGFFSNANSSGLAIDGGIVLSSGFVEGISGPNSSSGYTGVINTPGDADLNSLIPGYTTFDATVLEFDFVPNSNGITFSYVFASDEYLEYVNSSFNDVFGFFLNGVNVPLVPNTTTPVAINSINHLVNTEYFVNNDIHHGPGMGFPPPVTYDIEADGFTTILTVEAYVNQGQQNHIRFAIADAGDRILDSWVFMEAGSFSSVFLTALDVVVDGGVLQQTDEDIPVDINISAIGFNNADFDWVLSNPIWGSAQFVDDDRYMQEDRVIRYSPNPDYNGYDSFVCAVYDNLGHSIDTVIGINVIHLNDPPQNTVPPQISGNFMVGNEVVCDPGEWNDDVDNQHVPYWEPFSTITLSYQWQRSIDSRNWEDIDAAVELNYLLQTEDAEHNIRCQVTAVDDGTGLGDDNTTILASNEEYCSPLVNADIDLLDLPTAINSITPNPFNPSTKIAFSLNQESNVKVDIVNIKGELIRSLVDSYYIAGIYDISWNGKDNSGRSCSSGIYFSILKTEKEVDSQKMILLK